ncbi:unnamed protein product [Durusdinium trenchii]|uniref:Nudix hydrolase domain-containing protein n=1 Tax=Durusdinium trenchii TaxID=1381693 RepID=A0ABP0L042_9DINO
MDEAFELLISPKDLGTVQAEQVDLSFSVEHNRLEHPEDEIESSWEAALAKNPRLFNGSKFRLRRVSLVSSTCPPVLTMELGLTSYKEYLGTNRLSAEKRKRFEDDGQKHGDKGAHFSNALGCEAVLCTSDQQMVLLRRSGAVGTHAGLYNGPSGHPEPKNLGLDDVLPDPSRELSEAVRRELFQSALDEVVAETGVAVETLSEPVLMGIMVDSTQKPDALFFVRRVARPFVAPVEMEEKGMSNN